MALQTVKVPKVPFKPDKFTDVVITGIVAIAVERLMIHYIPIYSRVVGEAQRAGEAEAAKISAEQAQAKAAPVVEAVPDNLYFLQTRK